MNSDFSNQIYLFALVVTLFFEIPVIWFAYRKRASLILIVTVFLFTNLFTHGTFWSTFNYVPGSYMIKVIGFEVLIWFTEAGFYKMLLDGSIVKAVIASFMANSLSVVAGYLMWGVLKSLGYM